MSGTSATSEQIQELQRQLEDTEKERDEFCSMVVELETKFLQLTNSENAEVCLLKESAGKREELERRIVELERRNAAMDAEREALDVKCSEIRQRSREQVQRIDELLHCNERLKCELDAQKEALSLAESHFADDKASLRAQKDAEVVQLQKELALQMTECEGLADSLRNSQQMNAQLNKKFQESQNENQRLMNAAQDGKGCKLQDQRVIQLTKDKDEAMALVSQMRGQVEKARDEMDEKYAENERSRQELEAKAVAETHAQDLCANVKGILERLTTSDAPTEVVAKATIAVQESQLKEGSAKQWTVLVECALQLLSWALAQPQSVQPPSHAPTCAVPRTPANVCANMTTPVKSEGRWQELRNIQSGDKWFKCPDVAAFSEATKKAQIALRQAEEELLRSRDKSKAYREPWTPPLLGSSLADRCHERTAVSSAVKSGKKDMLERDLESLLEEAQVDSRVALENVPPSSD